MKTNLKLVMFAALLALGSRAAAAQGALFEPRIDEALLGPFPVNHTVQGVPLSGSVFAFLSLQIEGELLRINARLVTDLSDLQRKADSLVDTIPLPKDNCAHSGVDNLVVTIGSKEISISGSVATLQLKGDVEIWTCFPPFKTRNLRQPVEATIPFRLVSVNPQTVAIETGDPDVRLRGDLGNLLGEILKILGVDINGRVKEALNRAVDPNLLRASIPEDLLRLNPAITRAELLSNSGALAATLEINATVDADVLAELIGVLDKDQAGE